MKKKIIDITLALTALIIFAIAGLVLVIIDAWESFTHGGIDDDDWNPEDGDWNPWDDDIHDLLSIEDDDEDDDEFGFDFYGGTEE